MGEWPPSEISLTKNGRVLFLTKDPSLIKAQLYDGLDLKMKDLDIEDLMDDINTDVMTPAWVCFDHEPAVIAENAYAGLLHEGERVFRQGALKEGGFEVIVSGPLEFSYPSWDAFISLRGSTHRVQHAIQEKLVGKFSIRLWLEPLLCHVRLPKNTTLDRY